MMKWLIAAGIVMLGIGAGVLSLYQVGIAYGIMVVGVVMIAYCLDKQGTIVKKKESHVMA